MSKSLIEIAKQVIELEEENISPKLNSLVESGLVESTDKNAFRTAYSKLRKGGIETKLTEQERVVVKGLVVKLLEMVEQAPEFFNLVRKELTTKK